MKIRELLSDESKWIQGAYAIDAKGRTVHPQDPRAERWCLLGAVSHCYRDGEEREQIKDRIGSEFRLPLSGYEVANWNDWADFSEVKALVDRLDI